MTNFAIAQTIEIGEIENSKLIYANDSMVFVVGYNYKPDGFGQLSRINAYDTSLNFKWTYKLDESHTNTIDKVLINNDRIIFTGLIGERTGNNLKTDRYIRVLNLKGEIFFDQNIGTSTYYCSNLLVYKDEVSLCFQRCETTYFSDMMYKSKNVLVQCNLKNKKIKIDEHFLIRSQPEFLKITNNKYLLFGEQYKNEKFNVTQTFIKTFPIAEKEIILPAEKMESISKVVSSKDGFAIVSYSNPFVENQERYLRLDIVDSNLRLLTTKTIPFSKLGWYHINLYFPIIENEFWFYSFKSENEASFSKLNENGEITEEIKSNIVDGSNNFFPTKEFIYHLYKEEEKLKVSKIKR